MEENLNPETLEQVQVLLRQLRNFGISLVRPWRLYQLAILLGIFAVGQIIALIVAPRMNAWMHGLEGWPMWRLRVLVLINQRVRSITFVLFAWLIYLVMQEITWPSRSYLIGLIAQLATALLVISIATRLMRNRTFRRFVRWAAWIYVTLNILGLTDFAAGLLDGASITVGALRVSLLMVLKAGVTVIVLMIGVRILGNLIAGRIESNDDISPSMKVLSVKVMQMFLYGFAIVIGIQSIGFDMTSLTVLSGAIGLGLGFGLQKVVSNLVSGVILLLDKSIKPGDVISLGDTFGWISSLGARYVSVLTRDGTEFLIPNEDLITNRVVNWSHSSDLVRLDIHFGVSYDADPHEVKRIAATAPKGVSRVINVPAPVCHVTAFGDSSVDFILRFWIKDPTSGLTNVRGNVYLSLWDALKDANIEIPYPRRDVTVLNPPPAAGIAGQSQVAVKKT